MNLDFPVSSFITVDLPGLNAIAEQAAKKNRAIEKSAVRSSMIYTKALGRVFFTVCPGSTRC